MVKDLLYTYLKYAIGKNINYYSNTFGDIDVEPFLYCDHIPRKRGIIMAVDIECVYGCFFIRFYIEDGTYLSVQIEPKFNIEQFLEDNNKIVK